MRGYMIGAALFAVYAVAAALPLESLWFDPSEPFVSDAVVGQDPHLRFSRQIKVPVEMSFSVILRHAETLDVACTANGGPFEYLPAKSGPLLNKGVWWFAPSDDCRNLPVGIYFGSVTWTAAYPMRPFLPSFLRGWLGWIIPPKTVTREILAFQIMEVKK